MMLLLRLETTCRSGATLLSWSISMFCWSRHSIGHSLFMPSSIWENRRKWTSLWYWFKSVRASKRTEEGPFSKSKANTRGFSLKPTFLVPTWRTICKDRKVLQKPRSRQRLSFIKHTMKNWVYFLVNSTATIHSWISSKRSFFSSGRSSQITTLMNWGFSFEGTLLYKKGFSPRIRVVSSTRRLMSPKSWLSILRAFSCSSWKRLS